MDFTIANPISTVSVSPTISKAVVFFILLFNGQIASAQFTVALLSTPPTCNGQSNGKINAIPSGGIAPFTYLWSNGSTANPLMNIPAGFYALTVTSAIGSTATTSVTLPDPPLLQAAIAVTSCTLPGSMTVNPVGGVPPYEYLWNNGQTTQSIGNLNPGQYCVTITDASLCSLVKCQSIGANFGVQVVVNHLMCGSPMGGSATASLSGGVSPFTYLWSNGSTNSSITNLPPGSYSVTVTAANGCSSSGSGTVLLASGNFSIDVAVNEPTCNGSSTGILTANPNNGAPPFTYAWSNGKTTQTISGLPAGSYTVTVTDMFGCTATQTAILNYQSSLSVSLNPFNPTCSGANNGSISANPSNGVPSYSYNWSTGASTQTINNIGPGAYTVTVTDGLGCTATKSISLVSPPPFLVTTNSSNATECGAANGSASALPGGGGSPPFSYQWSNGATGNVVNGLIAGTYIVTVTSIQGCMATATATVSQPTSLDVSIMGSTIVCGNDNNGTLTANYTNGTAPYSFAWSNGGSAQTVNNLAPGIYTVTVTSAQGCTGTASSNINGSPGIALDISVQNVKCFGTATGKITVSASGGTLPIAFSWSNGSAASVLSNLQAGQYTLTVSDAVGCSKIQTITVTQPAALNVGFSTSGGSCGSNGVATAAVSGGTMPYQFAWNSGQTTQSIFGIPPGDYQLTVTDANQCTAAANTSLTAFPLPQLMVSGTNTTCNGTSDGTVLATASAGTPPYNFNWSNGITTPDQAGLSPGNYKVTVTDNNGCTKRDSVIVLLGDGLIVGIDAPIYVCPGETVAATASAMGGIQPYTFLWSNGQTSQTATNLNSGNYSVVVTDPMGCSGIESVLLLPGGGYGVNFSFENVSCAGGQDGSAALSINGGAPPYKYLWETGDTLPAIDSLFAGEYQVTISDATGCTNTQVIPINEPPPLMLNLMGFDGGCGGTGSANAQVSGGTPPYMYNWSNGADVPTINNLGPGSYAITMTDGNLCTLIDSTTIIEIPVPTCEIVLAQPVSAPGLSDGGLEVLAAGGTPPFVYNWNNGQTAETATGLNPGTYLVTVSDANNCQSFCSYTLFSPGLIGDFAWKDNNMNGRQDNGEGGLANVKIDISGLDNYGEDFSNTMTTGADGQYLFTVQPGKYKLAFSLPNGYTYSPLKMGSDSSQDSDVNPLTGMTDTITIGNGEANYAVDAGFFVASPCDNVTGAGTVCCGQSFCGPGSQPDELTQSSAPAGGTGNLQYQWFYSTAPVPFDPLNYLPALDANEANWTPDPVSQNTYFVRGARREGCVQYLYSNVVEFKVDSLAIAAIEGPDTTCVGVPIDFTCLDNGPGATYAWSFGGGTPDTANSQSVAGVSWASTGMKTVRLTVENQGCISMDELQVIMSNSPYYCGDALIINAEAVGPTTVLVDWFYASTDSLLRSYVVEWAWEGDDFTAVGIPDSTVASNSFLHYFSWHDSAKRGRNYYRVKLGDSDGTILYSNVVEVFVSGGYTLVHAYPNPFSSYLDVEIIDRYDANITLELITVFGQKIGVFQAPDLDNYMQINTSGLAPGSYFLLVKYDGKPQKIFKLVKWRQE
ncbi:MAG: T9SS type A sorting domain-containing protein [Lewinellaceae bacterium]|nr:T9SS type A sorting domain-containing protein [Lewinellaceae bacterium]